MTNEQKKQAEWVTGGCLSSPQKERVAPIPMFLGQLKDRCDTLETIMEELWSKLDKILVQEPAETNEPAVEVNLLGSSSLTKELKTRVDHLEKIIVLVTTLIKRLEL